MGEQYLQKEILNAMLCWLYIMFLILLIFVNYTVLVQNKCVGSSFWQEGDRRNYKRFFEIPGNNYFTVLSSVKEICTMF